MNKGQLTSYGILLYRKQGDTIQYLLGKIPRGNFWTVFKGMPGPNETPEVTALREFAEETGSSDTLTAIDECTTTATTLTGTARKKKLSIFLKDGSNISESIFNIDRVVKIDHGFMAGRPEIVAIRW